MAEPLIVEIDATHLYPGAVGRFRGDPPAGPARRDCLLVFTDAATASGVLTDGRDARLAVAAHTTAAGTTIAAKQWLLALRPDANAVQLRVVRRIVEDPERAG